MATDLLEREAHLAQLEEHLRQAAAGHGRVVLMGGEAGVGKTTLANAFCQHVTGATVLRTWCDALATPRPLSPLRDLAPALGLSIDPGAGTGEDREQLYRSVLASLAARPNPTIIVAEDAHWGDGASIELLRFISRRIEGLRVLYVITYRDDEIGPDHPLRLLLGDLASAPAVHRLPVLPLTVEAVREMASGSGRDTAALHLLTGGNPFFLTEVLAAETGTIPATVGDAILARAARLSPDARAVLDISAVIGASIDTDLLLRVAGPVLDEADECIARGLLRSTDDGLAFRHALARDAVLAAISPPRRRMLHARVLAALRDDPATTRDLARLVHHAEAAGDRSAVVTLATAAAEQAATLYAHREAAAQYARALRFGDHLPAAERARLLEGRSVACYYCASGAEAIAARLAALDLWRRLGDSLKEGANLRWLSRLYWSQGLGREAEDAATAALDVLERLPPGPELAMAYSNFAQLRMLADDADAALYWGERAIALAEELGETETLVHALANVGTARLNTDDQRGRPQLEHSLRLAQQHGLADHAGRALTNLAWNGTQFFRFADAERRYAEAIAYTVEHDLDFYRWYLVASQTIVLTHRGDWDEAAADARQVLRQPAVSPLAQIIALGTVGLIAARRGDAEATAFLDDAMSLAARTGQLLRMGPIRLARAEAALLAGDLERARAETEAVRELVVGRGQPWQRGEFAWLLRQLGEQDVAPENIAPPYVLLLAGDFAAAAALWQELGCPYAAARALDRGDDPDQVRHAIATFQDLGARPALAMALRHLRQLGVRDLPPVRRGPRSSTRANPAGLTQREAEILALVAMGLRNAEIGDRLFLSPKTVGHHLSSIYAKLGVASRTDAARLAAQLGITVP